MSKTVDLSSIGHTLKNSLDHVKKRLLPTVGQVSTRADLGSRKKQFKVKPQFNGFLGIFSLVGF
jgi:hypothetical protein